MEESEIEIKNDALMSLLKIDWILPAGLLSLPLSTTAIALLPHYTSNGTLILTLKWMDSLSSHENIFNLYQRSKSHFGYINCKHWWHSFRSVIRSSFFCYFFHVLEELACIKTWIFQCKSRFVCRCLVLRVLKTIFYCKSSSWDEIKCRSLEHFCLSRCESWNSECRTPEKAK